MRNGTVAFIAVLVVLVACGSSQSTQSAPARTPDGTGVGNGLSSGPVVQSPGTATAAEPAAPSAAPSSAAIGEDRSIDSAAGPGGPKKLAGSCVPPGGVCTFSNDCCGDDYFCTQRCGDHWCCKHR